MKKLLYLLYPFMLLTSFAVMSQNVGIGTTNPQQKLDVNGITNATSGFNFGNVPVIFNSSADVYMNVRVLQNNSASLTDGMYLNYNSTGTTNGHLRFYANGTTLRGYIDASNGNFGMGIGSTPWARITSVTAGTERQIAANSWADMSSDAAGYGFFGGNMYTGQSDNSWRYANSHGSIGGIGFAVNYPGWNKASVITSGTTSSTAGSSFSPNTIATFKYDGNVGIGNTDPGYRLTVSSGGIGGNYGLLPNYAGWAAYGTGDGGAAIYNDNGGYQKLMIVGNNSAGGARQVGLWDFLQVNGTIQITGGSPGAGKVLTSDASGNATWQTPSSGGVTSSCGSVNYLPKMTSATNIGCSQVFDNGTNVGIGTAGPSYKLHVLGDVYANGGWFRVSGTNGIYWESYGGGWYMFDGTWMRTYNDRNVWAGGGLIGCDGGLTIGYGGGSPRTNGGSFSGRVGIGFQLPDYKLSVVNTDGSSSGGVYISSSVANGICVYSTAGSPYWGMILEGGGAGIWARCTGADGTGIQGISSGNQAGMFGQAGGYWGNGVLGINPFGGVGVYCQGNFSCTGSKSAIVRTDDGPKEMYCVESPDSWFEDFGSAVIQGKKTRVELKKDYASTVTVSNEFPMKIFIQMEDSRIQYKITKGDGWFELEITNDSSTALGTSFDYRIVAKRKYFEKLRMKSAPASYADYYLYPDINDVPQEYRLSWVKRIPLENQAEFEKYLTSDQKKLLMSTDKPKKQTTDSDTKETTTTKPFVWKSIFDEKNFNGGE